MSCIVGNASVVEICGKEYFSLTRIIFYFIPIICQCAIFGIGGLTSTKPILMLKRLCFVQVRFKLWIIRVSLKVKMGLVNTLMPGNALNLLVSRRLWLCLCWILFWRLWLAGRGGAGGKYWWWWYCSVQCRLAGCCPCVEFGVWKLKRRQSWWKLKRRPRWWKRGALCVDSHQFKTLTLFTTAVRY